MYVSVLGSCGDTTRKLYSLDGGMAVMRDFVGAS